MWPLKKVAKPLNQILFKEIIHGHGRVIGDSVREGGVVYKRKRLVEKVCDVWSLIFETGLICE